MPKIPKPLQEIATPVLKPSTSPKKKLTKQRPLDAPSATHQMSETDWNEIVAPVFTEGKALDISQIETAEDLQRLTHAFLEGYPESVKAAKSRSGTATKARLQRESAADLQGLGLTEEEALQYWNAEAVPPGIATRIGEEATTTAGQRMAKARAAWGNAQAKLEEGVVQDEVVQDLAEASGLTPSMILKRAKSEGWNTETLVRAHMLMKNINDTLAAKIRALPRDPKTGLVSLDQIDPAEKIALLQASHIAAAINIQIRGAESEAGRVLRMVGLAKKSGANMEAILAKGGDMTVSPAKAAGQIFERKGVSVDEQLSALINVVEENPNAVGKMTVDLTRATSYDMLLQLMFNNMLGSFRTDGVNIGSNLVIGVMETLALAQGGLAGAVSRGTRRAMGTARAGSAGGVDPDTGIPFGPNEGLTLNAGLRQLVTTLKTIPEALMLGAKSVAKREPPAVLQANPAKPQEFQSAPSVAEKYFGTEGQGDITVDSLAALLGRKEPVPTTRTTQLADALLDYGFRSSMILLGAEDAVFKALWYRSTVEQLAIEEGIANKLRGRALRDYVQQITYDPMSQASHIHLQAVEIAQKYTLTSPPGRLAANFGRLLYDHRPGVRFLARIIVPFFNVLNNLVKYSVEMMPLTQAGQEAVTQIGRALNALQRVAGKDAPTGYTFGTFSKGLHHPNPRVRDWYWGKVIVGAEMLTVMTILASEGMILGGDNAKAWVTHARAEKRRIRHTPGEGEYMLVVPWSVLDPDGKWKGVYHDGHDAAYLIDRYEPLGAFLAQAGALSQALQAYDFHPSDDLPFFEATGDVEMGNEMLLQAIFAVGEKTADSAWMKGVTEFISSIYQSNRADSETGERMLPRWVKMVAEKGTTFTPIMGHNLLRDAVKAEDPHARATDPQKWNLVETDEGTVTVRTRPAGVDDILALLVEDYTAQLQSRLPPSAAATLSGSTMGSIGLPKIPSYFGGSRQRPLHVGPSGRYWNNVQTERRMYDRQPFLTEKVFTEAEVSRATGLRGLSFGLPTTPGMEPDELIAAKAEEQRWKKFLDIGGVWAEFERLGWFPSEHPKFLLAGRTKIPLSAQQQYDFVQILNGHGEDVGLREAWEKKHPGESYDYVSNVIDGRDLYGRIEAFMYTPRYQRASDHPDDARPGKETKAELIQEQIDWARHGRGSEKQGPPTGGDAEYGGAERGLLILHPELLDAVAAGKLEAVQHQERVQGERLAVGEGRTAQGGPESPAPDSYLEQVRQAIQGQWDGIKESLE